MKRWILIVLMALLCGPVLVFADDPTTSSIDLMPHDIYIPKGTVTFETYGAYAGQPTGTREQLYSETTGIGYYFLNNNSLSFEVIGMYGSQPEQDVGAIGFGLMLRTHLIVRQNWSIFGDFAPRIYEASHAIPPTGTDFNFAFHTGVGATVHLWDNINLMTGVRYMHLSNARLQGPEHNPSLNAIEGYLGVLIQL